MDRTLPLLPAMHPRMGGQAGQGHSQGWAGSSLEVRQRELMQLGGAAGISAEPGGLRVRDKEGHKRTRLGKAVGIEDGMGGSGRHGKQGVDTLLSTVPTIPHPHKGILGHLGKSPICLVLHILAVWPTMAAGPGLWAWAPGLRCSPALA